MNLKKIELLSPAANAETAIQAILHGADAVYIGPPSHGARKAVSNSIEDISRVVDFAHQYRAKVYATVNTIVYEKELYQVENLIKHLYKIGVDALIIQDLGILRMDIPPIALHASTQCDIRTPEKALFLQEVGFSQLVLARELSLSEIKKITSVVSIPVETFIHGALCVSYSGRCHASLALTGRSANRGECAQICRLPYTLIDSEGKVLCKDKYLLSLKDFNASHNLKDLIDAGVTSFKIEGRLKDISYVKNITSFYNIHLNRLIEENPGLYKRSSIGTVSLKFLPKPDKSFNRGFSNYFLEKRKPLKIASLLTPKSQGEKIKNVSELNNGDGISFYDKNGNFTGVNINRVEKNKIIPARKIDIPKNVVIYRTSDLKWEKLLNGETATRKIFLNLKLNNNYIKAQDERGVEVSIPLDIEYEIAKNPIDYRLIFEKLGNTPYVLKDFESLIDPKRFYRISELSKLRREITRMLNEANKINYPYEYRKEENTVYKYPVSTLDYKDNVSNSLAENFYRQHGVEIIEKAAEVTKKLKKGDVVMTARHCILRELGLCKKENKQGVTGTPYKFPLFLNYDGGKLQLDFDCKNCEMKVLL